MTFTFPDGDWPDTKRDHISLGFRTLQSDAVLLRITSASSNDIIEMELASDMHFEDDPKEMRHCLLVRAMSSDSCRSLDLFLAEEF